METVNDMETASDMETVSVSPGPSVSAATVCLIPSGCAGPPQSSAVGVEMEEQEDQKTIPGAARSGGS